MGFCSFIIELLVSLFTSAVVDLRITVFPHPVHDVIFRTDISAHCSVVDGERCLALLSSFTDHKLDVVISAVFYMWLIFEYIFVHFHIER